MKALKASIKDVVQPLAKKFHAALHMQHIKRKKPRIGKQQMVGALRRLGISSRDVVFLHLRIDAPLEQREVI